MIILQFAERRIHLKKKHPLKLSPFEEMFISFVLTLNTKSKSKAPRKILGARYKD